MDYAGKVAVVTASGNGIGRAVVLEFARRGSAVLVSDYDGEAAGRVAAEIVAAGGEATARRCDVTSDADVRALADDAFDHWGRVDVLMNHAGASIAGPVTKVSLDDWRWAYDVNILGAVRAVQAFLPRMAKQGDGLIINTTSSLGFLPELPVALPYITTKAGVIGLSEGLYLYCKPLGIRVMTLAPDITKTNFHLSGRITGISPEDAMSMLPLAAEQLPEDVSRALFDAIDDGRFLACNVPDVDRYLREKAEEGLQPAYRIFPELEEPVGAFVRKTI